MCREGPTARLAFSRGKSVMGRDVSVVGISLSTG